SGAGLGAVALDGEACALARACGQLVSASDGLAVVLDIGWESIRSVLLYQGAVVYCRRMSGYGLSRLHRAAQEQFELSPDVVEHLISRATSSTDQSEQFTELADQVQRLTRSHFDAVSAEVLDALAYASHQYPDAAAGTVLLAG